MMQADQQSTSPYIPRDAFGFPLAGEALREWERVNRSWLNPKRSR